MKRRLTYQFSILLLAFTILQCNNTNRPATLKFQPNDPFQETIVPSLIFEIDAKIDNVVEGTSGTILVIPKGSFKNSKGEIVTGNVEIELAEALSLEQMLLSNLTTTSNGELLETDGMIYLNASSNGEQLTIDKNNPIYIQIPTIQRKSGMLAYKGIRDADGNMNWVEPKELEKFLVPVDINLLNFYPEGFEAEVMTGLPFRNYNTATKVLTDSLYYSFSSSDGRELIEGLDSTIPNEPDYDKNKELEGGETKDQSYLTELDESSFFFTDYFTCGIDPAIIKVVKSEKFQNTLIATREFETRLQTIFKTGSEDIIEIYIKNIDRNLWELDSMAAFTLTESPLKTEFNNFYEQRLTNVKDANKYSELLQVYYNQQLDKIKAELMAAKEKLVKELAEKNEAARQVVDEYKELLSDREKYRMETYGFEWTDTGWINIDRGTAPKNWGPERLEILIQEGKNYDRVHTYIIYTSIKSLYRLNSSDNELFYVGNEQQKEMLMPKNRLAVGVSIAYQGDKSFLALKEFETGTDSELKLVLQPATMQKINDIIKTYDNYQQENRMDKDLEYMTLFAKESKRQVKLKSESQFILRLWNRVYNCEPALADSTSTEY